MTFRVDSRTPSAHAINKETGERVLPDADGWVLNSRKPIEAESKEEAEAKIEAELPMLKAFGLLPEDLEFRVVPLN